MLFKLSGPGGAYLVRRWARVLGHAVLGAGLLYALLLRPWMCTWGATAAEREAVLPGDDYIPGASIQATRAITLARSPAEVWPWLLQIGTRRAGWYSYDCLDNGCHPSAESILPEFQGLKQGDKVPITPDGKAGFPVALLIKDRLLGLGGGDGKVGALWAMVLEPLPEGRCRLILRLRMRVKPWYIGIPAQLLLEPVHFIMERKMLLGLQRRLKRDLPL